MNGKIHRDNMPHVLNGRQDGRQKNTDSAACAKNQDAEGSDARGEENERNAQGVIELWNHLDENDLEPPHQGTSDKPEQIGRPGGIQQALQRGMRRFLLP